MYDIVKNMEVVTGVLNTYIVNLYRTKLHFKPKLQLKLLPFV